MKIPQAWMARENAQLLVNAYVDEELDAAASLQVEQMMASNPALKAEHERLLSLKLGLAAHRRDDRASAALRDRITAIGTAQTADLRPQRRFSFLQMAASVLVAVVLGSGGTYFILTHDFTSAEVRSLVSAHERALLAPEPFMVASSDTHTVKPWFDTHVALSPQVIDLATAGFPLAGGRIDDIEGKEVPVQVFHRRAHVISLVATPVPGSRDDAGMATRSSRDGYNVLGWAGRDFGYSAVADLSPDELASFVAAWRAAARNLP